MWVTGRGPHLYLSLRLQLKSCQPETEGSRLPGFIMELSGRGWHPWKISPLPDAPHRWGWCSLRLRALRLPAFPPALTWVTSGPAICVWGGWACCWGRGEGCCWGCCWGCPTIALRRGCWLVGGLYMAGVPSGFTKGWPAVESHLGQGKLLKLSFGTKNHSDRYSKMEPKAKGQGKSRTLEPLPVWRLDCLWPIRLSEVTA